MGPIVIGHLPVVLFDCDEESGQGLVVKPFQAKKVDEHEEGLPDLFHVVHVEGVEGEAVNEKKLIKVSRCQRCAMNIIECTNYIWKKRAREVPEREREWERESENGTVTT